MARKGTRYAIPRLVSGGIITNYDCTSRCRHCLYACSPRRPRDAMSEETLRPLLRTIRSRGCASVHVGGGEPLLRPGRLERVLATVREEGVGVDYVETNASWYRGEDEARRILAGLRRAGLRTLLVSMSPFHNEHIPFSRVKGVLAACRAEGVGVFPWIQGFYGEIDRFDDRTTHSLEAYEDCYGPGYLAGIPARYWVHPGGRALSTFSRVWETHPADGILAGCDGGCAELLDTSHFHVDLYGRYIPGLCSGLAVRAEDLGSELDGDRYPLVARLLRDGVAGLAAWARERHGIAPAGRYLNRCHLCHDIRARLVRSEGASYEELHPASFYDEAVA